MALHLLLPGQVSPQEIWRLRNLNPRTAVVCILWKPPSFSQTLQLDLNNHPHCIHSQWPASAPKCKLSSARSGLVCEIGLLTCVICAHSSNLLIVLGMMQVAKKIPFDDPNVLNMCRAAYLLSNLIIIGITLYIKAVVDKKKGTALIPSDAPAQRKLAHQY